MSSANPFDFVSNYWVDAWQRSILALDVLRERGDIYLEHNAKNAPNVLKFEAELVTDGRTLPRPVNYVLARILPQDGGPTDPTMRPFIVVDPRAGHGPGIGGMKQDSEIGVAMAAGHPCYFIGFLPNPEPGQTVEDVCIAEARFIEAVVARHPQAEGKPAVIGNCQAGWQLMLTAALAPDLMGPIVLAGSPLSYWAGVRGKNPLRYLGGVLGGTWLTALAGDMGKGIFDGANLVSNFESLNPANTYWEKPYGLYSKVDSEAERFLDFETWWGSPVLLNAGEMQWIADNLFVGNKLAAGEILRLQRQACRPAQHQVSDHRVLLVGRQHHAAATGARLDHRSLRPRAGYRRERPDHRLHDAPDDRPSRHLRVRQGGEQGTRRIRQLHGYDRPAAARSL